MLVKEVEPSSAIADLIWRSRDRSDPTVANLCISIHYRYRVPGGIIGQQQLSDTGAFEACSFLTRA